MANDLYLEGEEVPSVHERGGSNRHRNLHHNRVYGNLHRLEPPTLLQSLDRCYSILYGLWGDTIAAGSSNALYRFEKSSLIVNDHTTVATERDMALSSGRSQCQLVLPADKDYCTTTSIPFGASLVRLQKFVQEFGDCTLVLKRIGVV
ncbi:hypothetical protein BU15DRAFT_58979 [Melanogaster broomeanus]|nr:hypothetical protein BU15DRAFT_58979 [Melanogaster broomeanus]